VIEVIDSERCTQCNICVRVCPTDVFERVPDGPPRIARQDSCQTCFMCEVNCPDDAMYVAPLRDPAPADSVHLDVELLKSQGYLGSFRHRLGWGDRLTPPDSLEALAALAQNGPRRLEQPESSVKPRVIA
jgi:NAD-dependent dihydropyrimidine dehydrogenase PreA subunit